jgi:hypothetical protein
LFIHYRVEIKCKRLDELENPNFEVLWVHAKPNRLPRGVTCVILACIYHPPSLNDHDHEIFSRVSFRMLNEGRGSASWLCHYHRASDFNKLDIKIWKRNFQLKQLARSPTRGSINILDLVLTNLHKFYDLRSVEIPPPPPPPFGLSGDNTITICPK